MSSPLDPYQDQVDALVGIYGSTGSFTAVRPDYTSSAEAPLTSGLSLRLDPRGGRSQLQNPLPGVVYFVVAGDKTLFQPGDRVFQSPSDGSTPSATIIQNLSMSDVTGFRSNRTAQIISTTINASPIYDLIYFDYADVSKASEGIIPEFESAKQVETNRAIVYFRENIVKGYRLIDLATMRRFMILAVAQRGNQLMLQLQGDKG